MSRRAATLLAGLLAAATTQPAGASAQRTPASVTVASKPFAESFILAEVFAQVLEARGFAVVRRPGLGATEIAFAAVTRGDADVYPEYTGTGLLAVLGEPPGSDPARVYGRVASESLRRHGVHWLPPLGFENTYAIAVRPGTADSLGLRTLSDLARHAPDLVGGFSPDFLGRPDGLPGLRAAYDLRFASERSLLQAVKYRALVERGVDVIDGYSTDGLIDRYGLVVLEDDRGFFPPYEASAVVSSRLWNEHPGAVAELTRLSGRLDVQRMRTANRRVEVDGESPAEAAAWLLDEIGVLGASGEVTAPTLPRTSWLAWVGDRRGDILENTLRHLFLVGTSLLAALGFALPLGLALERTPRLAESVIRGTGTLQTLPSIALLAFMIPLLGIGVVPAIVALFLYSIFPIVRNTYTGVTGASPAAVAAARAVGMTPYQTLRHVRLPLAAPVIMAGVRTAAVINVGTATLAAFIGAGGLGDPIVAGLALSDTRLILSGAVPAALLALLVDGALAVLERVVTPPGVRRRAAASPRAGPSR